MGQRNALGHAVGKWSSRIASTGTDVSGYRLAGFSRVAVIVGIGLFAANCTGETKLTSKIDPKYGVAASPRVVKPGDPVPKGGGTYRVGKPYVVAGKTYTPSENTQYRSEGLASWYGDDFHGRLTANGEVYDMKSIAAAHPTLPMPCYVRVTNMGNGRSMVVRVNDRGPYHGNRVIDVSERAADLLGFKAVGTARVRVEYVGRAPLEGSDDLQLVATLRENGKQVAPTGGTMFASVGNLFSTKSRASAPVPAMAEVPVPPSRPFELGDPVGEEAVASAQAAPAPQVAYAAPAINPVRTASKPAQPAKPAQQSVAAVTPKPAPVPAPAPAPAPQVAYVAPAPVARMPGNKPKPAAPNSAPVAIAQAAPLPAAVPNSAQSLAATGWVVGAQPAMNYADTAGRGLY